MEENGKIYITISDKRTDGSGIGGDGGSGRNGYSGTTSQKSGKGQFASYLLHKTLDFAKNEAMNMINYSINNIGNFTGNFVGQRHIQQTIQGAKMLGNIAMATASGGWVGLVVSVASQATNIGLSEYQQYFENRRLNHNIDMLRNLSGLNQLSDGSRGTLG